MTNQIKVQMNLHASATAEVELPEGYEWLDVVDWHITWDTLYLLMHDSSEHSISLETETTDIVDWKRPVTTNIFSADGDKLT